MATYQLTYAEERLRKRGWIVNPTTGCWEVSGSPCSIGYQQIRVDYKRYLAHRVAYEVWVGPIPPSHEIRHKCDNPPCINPEHLETGTRADNARDIVERGRSKTGTKHWNSRLTEANVLDIVQRRRKGERRDTIADEYGVSGPLISQITSGNLWSSVTGILGSD